MSNKKMKMGEIHIPKAENVLKETEPKVVIKWLDRIEKAKRDGQTNCYLCAADGLITKNAVERFLKAGYDLNYSHFEFDGSWFVKAFWHDGCNGKLYNSQNREYVDVDTMFKC